ncbi:MAG: membrane protein insertion efficiency factor YidD [Simkaniaceae bacterium]|nr:membrane protein insertion efficiency factor YidD [Simkaniaceae bacterium]
MRFSLLLIPVFLCGKVGYHTPWGKDSELLERPRRELPAQSRNPLTRAFESLIRLKQNHISPIDGPRSHYRPSSSQYMLEAIRYHGFIVGFSVGCDRLLRENSDEWFYPTVKTHEGKFKYDPVLSRSEMKTHPSF